MVAWTDVLTWAFDGVAGWEDRLAILGQLLDDWLVMLPARDADQPADVPWDTLRGQLGTVDREAFAAVVGTP
jgi:hypothetical protein